MSISTSFQSGASAIACRHRLQRRARRFPRQAEQLIAEARQLLRGHIRLPGSSKPTFCGNPPRWHQVFGHDDESLWILNRHWHWRPLLVAWVLTDEQAFAERVIQEAEDWLQNCPVPSPDNLSEFRCGVSPWRSLEIGIRMFESWDSLWLLLPGSGLVTPEFFNKLRSSMAEHGRILYGICPQFWPRADHNHYLMENLGLLAICRFAPELDADGTWQRHALHELNRCALNQITADGGQLEGCPGYHDGALEWFSKVCHYCHELGVPTPPAIQERLTKMLDYALAATRPNGETVPWGDSDSDMTANLKSILTGALFAGHPEYLNYLSYMFGREQLEASLGQLAFWPDVPALPEDLGPRQPPLPRLSVQHELHQAMVHSDWTRQAGSLFFACRTPVQNGHSHQDPGGFDYCAYGQPLLVDPGRFCYREEADRRWFKSAFSHNTATLNRQEPFDYIDTWRYGEQQRGGLTVVRETPDGIWLQSQHQNYAPAILTRTLYVDLQQQFIILWDRVDNAETIRSLELNFHVNGTDVALMDGTALARVKNVNLKIQCSLRGTVSMAPGRVSPALDQTRPSTLLQWSFSVTGKSFEVITAICPWQGNRPAPTVSLLPDRNVQINGNIIAPSIAPSIPLD